MYLKVIKESSDYIEHPCDILMSKWDFKPVTNRILNKLGLSQVGFTNKRDNGEPPLYYRHENLYLVMYYNPMNDQYYLSIEDTNDDEVADDIDDTNLDILLGLTNGKMFMPSTHSDGGFQDLESLSSELLDLLIDHGRIDIYALMKDINFK